MTMAPAEGYHLENASTSTLATTIADTAMSAKPVKNPSSESLHYREDEGRLLLTEAHFVLGRLLGVGSFNSVYEAKIDAAKVDLPPQQSSVVATTYALKRPRMRQQPPRRTSSSSSLNNNEDDDKDNNGGGRYKELARQTAIADLEREADLLSGLDHANVIRLHWTIRDASLKGDGPILVMDRLRYTLADKISQWAWAVHDGDEPPTAAAYPKHNKTSKAQPRRRFSIGGSKKKATRRRSSMGTALPVVKAKNKKKFLKRADAFLPDRLGAVLDVAEGIKYLHSRGVAHRDLKPENIGFDDEGNAKIFDFGVAKRLNDVSDDSGQTGTLRYMAPEVARSERCNVLDADKYSFALILWEVCSLERAYNDIGRMELSRDVHLLQGGRRGSDGNAGGNRGGGGGDARGSRGKNRKTSSASSGAGRRTRRFSWIDKSRRRGSDNSTVSEHDSTEDEGPLRPKLSPSWPRDVRDVIARCWSDDPRERAPWDEAIGVLRREHEAGGAAGGKGGRPSLCTTTSLSSFSHASDDNKAENNSDDVTDNASFSSNGSSTTSQGLCKNPRVRKSPSCDSILEASAREEGLSSDVESYHTCAEPEEEEEESEWNVHKCNDTTAKEEAARAKWWCSTRRTFQPPSLVPGRNPVPPEEVRCLTR